MEFCPTCGNLLQFQNRGGGGGKGAGFFCRACPYICSIEKTVKIKRGVQLAKKEAQPVALGQRNDGPITDAPCPKCGHGKAGYHQQQTRSADEPMTIFYNCMNSACRHNWRED